ncbi:hypothetical protein [Halioglobus maricola]|uniref:hypothetical protein n=1 Tax=Halioglobus maricola TaxID=2601894 RepID=UPI001293460B|nr:hypothetical protein [Halioglobus maricola]
MYIQRTLLLTLVVLLVCFPFIADWLTSDFSAWHRPYLVWSFIIFIAWLSQRSRHSDEL